MIPQVVASERGEALKPCIVKWNILENLTIEGESPVHERKYRVISSMAEPVKLCLKMPAPSGKAKYYWETDSEPVLWRKGEKNPKQGSEKNLKPYAYKRSECWRYTVSMTACLLHNEPTSYSSLASLIP